MTGVKAAAASVCMALLITALVRYMAPKGLTQEMMRLVSGLFVLVTLAGAFRGAATVVSGLQWEEFTVDTTLAETVQQQNLHAAEAALYEYIHGLLQAAGIAYDEVHIFFEPTDNPGDGSIVLDRIRVTAVYASQRERILALLAELFPGVHIEVTA